MNGTSVHLDCRGKAMWITIDRPQKRNALNDEVFAGIEEGLAAAKADPQISAVVLTGAGDKAFCSGADLDPDKSAFARGMARERQPGGVVFRSLLEHPKPIIARINGLCLAGGMGLLAVADLAVAARDARFGLPEVKVGVFPMMVAALLVHRLGIRDRDLMELSLLAEPIDADAAQRMGLLNFVVERGELDLNVERMVEQLALKSPTAIRLGKYSVRQMRSMAAEQALAYAETQIRLLGMTEDAREGIAAFAEKRSPKWTGR